MNKWLTEQCWICGSVNHIFIDYYNNVHAWECFFCGAKSWLNSDVMLEYMMQHDCNEEQAELDLQSNNENIFYVLGNYEENY